MRLLRFLMMLFFTLILCSCTENLPDKDSTETRIYRLFLEVEDGDTIVYKGIHMRFLGVDAPEVRNTEIGFYIDQPYGREAKKFTRMEIKKAKRLDPNYFKPKYRNLIGQIKSERHKKIEEIAKCELHKNTKLKAICKLLKDNISHYDWVGFYFVDKTTQNELVLGPFEGEPTEHVRIQFGRGTCGQAAQLKRTFIVQDVSKRNKLSLMQSKGKI